MATTISLGKLNALFNTYVSLSDEEKVKNVDKKLVSALKDGLEKGKFFTLKGNEYDFNSDIMELLDSSELNVSFADDGLVEEEINKIQEYIRLLLKLKEVKAINTASAEIDKLITALINLVIKNGAEFKFDEKDAKTLNGVNKSLATKVLLKKRHPVWDWIRKKVLYPAAIGGTFAAIYGGIGAAVPTGSLPGITDSIAANFGPLVIIVSGVTAALSTAFFLVKDKLTKNHYNKLGVNSNSINDLLNKGVELENLQIMELLNEWVSDEKIILSNGKWNYKLNKINRNRLHAISAFREMLAAKIAAHQQNEDLASDKVKLLNSLLNTIDGILLEDLLINYQNYLNGNSKDIRNLDIILKHKGVVKVGDKTYNCKSNPKQRDAYARIWLAENIYKAALTGKLPLTKFTTDIQESIEERLEQEKIADAKRTARNENIKNRIVNIFRKNPKPVATAEQPTQQPLTERQKQILAEQRKRAEQANDLARQSALADQAAQELTEKLNGYANFSLEEFIETFSNDGKANEDAILHVVNYGDATAFDEFAKYINKLLTKTEDRKQRNILIAIRTSAGTIASHTPATQPPTTLDQDAAAVKEFIAKYTKAGEVDIEAICLDITKNGVFSNEDYEKFFNLSGSIARKAQKTEKEGKITKGQANLASNIFSTAFTINMVTATHPENHPYKELFEKAAKTQQAQAEAQAQQANNNGKKKKNKANAQQTPVTTNNANADPTLNLAQRIINANNANKNNAGTGAKPETQTVSRDQARAAALNQQPSQPARPTQPATTTTTKPAPQTTLDQDAADVKKFIANYTKNGEIDEAAIRSTITDNGDLIGFNFLKFLSLIDSIILKANEACEKGKVTRSQVDIINKIYHITLDLRAQEQPNQPEQPAKPTKPVGKGNPADKPVPQTPKTGKEKPAKETSKEKPAETPKPAEQPAQNNNATNLNITGVEPEVGSTTPAVVVDEKKREQEKAEAARLAKEAEDAKRKAEEEEAKRKAEEEAKLKAEAEKKLAVERAKQLEKEKQERDAKEAVLKDIDDKLNEIIASGDIEAARSFKVSYELTLEQVSKLKRAFPGLYTTDLLSCSNEEYIAYFKTPTGKISGKNLVNVLKGSDIGTLSANLNKRIEEASLPEKEQLQRILESLIRKSKEFKNIGYNGLNAFGGEEHEKPNSRKSKSKNSVATANPTQD